MTDQDWLAERFEANRSHLRGVAFRMLGSLTEADDAVQEAWIRLSRTDTGDVANLRAWLTTVVGRVCLNISVRGRNEEVTAIELDPTQRVEFFRDTLGPVARGIPFGVRSSGSSMGSISTIRWKRPRVDRSSSSTRFADVG